MNRRSFLAILGLVPFMSVTAAEPKPAIQWGPWEPDKCPEPFGPVFTGGTPTYAFWREDGLFVENEKGELFRLSNASEWTLA